MKSLVLIPALYLISCHAAAIQSYRQGRDVPPNTATHATPTDVNLMASALGLTSIISPTLTPIDTTSARPTTTPTSIHSTQVSTAPTTGPPPPTLNPTTLCTNTSSHPSLTNYTSSYLCTPKLNADYALLGMYYVVCSVPSPSPQNSASNSTTTPAPPDTVFCCDPAYAQPSTFDALCMWGGGANITVGNLPPGFDPRNVTRPEGAAGVKRCMVSPVIRPGARCVQVLMGEEG